MAYVCVCVCVCMHKIFQILGLIGKACGCFIIYEEVWSLHQALDKREKS